MKENSASFGEILEGCKQQAGLSGRDPRYALVGSPFDELLCDFLSNGLEEKFTLYEIRLALLQGSLYIHGIPLFPMTCPGIAVVT